MCARMCTRIASNEPLTPATHSRKTLLLPTLIPSTNPIHTPKHATNTLNLSSILPRITHTNYSRKISPSRSPSWRTPCSTRSSLRSSIRSAQLHMYIYTYMHACPSSLHLQHPPLMHTQYNTHCVYQVTSRLLLRPHQLLRLNGLKPHVGVLPFS